MLRVRSMEEMSAMCRVLIERSHAFVVPAPRVRSSIATAIRAPLTIGLVPYEKKTISAVPDRSWQKAFIVSMVLTSTLDYSNNRNARLRGNLKRVWCSWKFVRLSLKVLRCPNYCEVPSFARSESSWDSTKNLVSCCCEDVASIL